MKIAIVNTHDIIGGAERCSYNLVTQLRQGGDDARLIVGGKRGTDSFVRQIDYGGIDWRLRGLVHNRLGWTDTTLMAPIRGCYTWPELRHADVVNIHNMHGAYWNFWTLPILSRRTPLILTLHDEWLLTGDCAYTYGCTKWKQQCGACPQASAGNPDHRACIGGADATRFNLGLKRKALDLCSADSIEIVAPSQWLLDRAAMAPHLARFPKRRIRYGVDLETFQPIDKYESRAALSLPTDETLLFAPAAHANDPRKNLSVLRESMRLPEWPRRCRVVVAGRADATLRRDFEDLPLTWLGYLKAPVEMARAISACDATLLVSKADNLPYTGLESLACGRPLIGAEVGGISEMIEPETTGWSWQLGADELAGHVARLASLGDAERLTMQRAARAAAEHRFDVRREADNYKALFTEAVTRRQRAPA